MTTDITEKGLETLIMRHLTGADGLSAAAADQVVEPPEDLAAAKAAGSGWLAGYAEDFDRTHALDVPQLFQFLKATQPATFAKLRPPSCRTPIPTGNGSPSCSTF